MMPTTTKPVAPAVFSFAEQMEERVAAAKEQLIPWLQGDHFDRPWSLDALRALRRERDALPPDLQDELDLVWRWEVPLLAYEERLVREEVDFETFAGRMHRYERRFWRERYRHDGQTRPRASADPPVCKHHGVTAAEIRSLASNGGCWDVDSIARATGATTTCGSCRLAVTRLLIDELAKAKAAGNVA